MDVINVKLRWKPVWKNVDINFLHETHILGISTKSGIHTLIRGAMALRCFPSPRTHKYRIKKKSPLAEQTEGRKENSYRMQKFLVKFVTLEKKLNWSFLYFFRNSKIVLVSEFSSNIQLFTLAQASVITQSWHRFPSDHNWHKFLDLTKRKEWCGLYLTVPLSFENQCFYLKYEASEIF